MMPGGYEQELIKKMMKVKDLRGVDVPSRADCRKKIMGGKEQP
jgi:hypothetical protein